MSHPSTWRTNADDSLVCPHKNLSVCRTCAEHEEVVDVVGAHYWEPDPAVRSMLRGELAR